MKHLDEISILNLGKYFYKLAERSQDVFWIRNTDYKTQLYISPAYEKIWGLSCESLYKDGVSWYATIHPEDKQAFELEISEIIHQPREGKSRSLEYRIVRPDGEERRIQEICFPIYDAASRFIGFAGIAKDVTKEKLRLKELELASYFFRYFTERIRAVFWVRDESCSNQIYLSSGYERIWERSRETLYNNPGEWINTLVPEDRELHTNEERMRQLVEQGPNVEYENRYRIATPSGEIRWIKDTSFPIRDDDQKFIGFAGIAEDVTKEVLHENELRDAKQRAEVANQAKSDFLAMISHELRTPLNAILGMTQILKSKSLPDDLEEYVDIISGAGTTLLALVSDVLDFARLEAGKLSFFNEPFDVAALFSQIVHSMQYLAKDKSVLLTLSLDSAIPSTLVGDANRVRQVLVNLIGNAIKFTEKGSVHVVLKALQATSSICMVEASVIDTGIGIQAEKLETVFEKFSQVDSIYHRRHGGIGLGLAITKQLVEAMGGQVSVQSVQGTGSTFTFTLALEMQDMTKHVGIAKLNPAVVHFKKYHLRVLLVEDNLINQKIARIMLEDLGCVVEVVDNGLQVVQQAEQLSIYDIIFMDVGLPDISGFDIVRKLRQLPALKEMPIIAMTAHILERDRQQAYESGMNRIVAKPISYNEIASVLEEYAKPISVAAS